MQWGDEPPPPQHPLAGGHPAALPAHIPFEMFLWEQPGHHSHAGSAGRSRRVHGHPVLPQPQCQPWLGMQHHAARTWTPISMSLLVFFGRCFWSGTCSRPVLASQGSTYPRHNGASPADPSCQADHLLCCAVASTPFCLPRK